ncbi:MAG: hypothetical protein Q4C96_06515 [Planctomycetia bacterium]|nr:hypothetical protein [Planctomycetia bacterium]
MKKSAGVLEFKRQCAHAGVEDVCVVDGTKAADGDFSGSRIFPSGGGTFLFSRHVQIAVLRHPVVGLRC